MSGADARRAAERRAANEAASSPFVPPADTGARGLVRQLHDALLTTHSYCALIAEGRRPALGQHAEQVASDRLERVDAALADAADYLRGN